MESVTFARMKLTFTPQEAFRHFLDNHQGPKEKEVQEAKYALDGLRKYPPGPRRIKRLLDKYAPGKYEFTEVVVFDDEK